jgi:hypothetical protein
LAVVIDATARPSRHITTTKRAKLRIGTRWDVLATQQDDDYHSKILHQVS